MKAIITIDMPDGWNLDDCKAFVAVDRFSYTAMVFEQCEIKKMPERFEPSILTDYCIGNADGWNACIEEITGETE